MGPRVGPTQKWQIWSLSAVDVDVRKWSSSHDSDLSRAPAPIAWPNFQQKSAFRELQPSVVFFYFAAYFAELDSFFFSLSPSSSLPLSRILFLCFSLFANFCFLFQSGLTEASVCQLLLLLLLAVKRPRQFTGMETGSRKKKIRPKKWLRCEWMFLLLM